eukprot:TRINITY_DN7011_c0_g1_i4.p1 TRINITY_DN7011_c0_g1~~TRINITY_DN7011_c0_g1_i4.p1  ORF type:complete len:401 (+),score=107.39 TRINITY_DN7011_c0_g1_i4:155-1357(+)
MDDPNNRVGLILALSSSAFIGSSFIIKKKGLIRSRASGHAAGDGGYAYLKESLWWLGLVTMIGGEVANFVAYAFAPAILVTPLGALSVIFSAILADRILGERLQTLGKVGCALCIIGSTVIVVNAPEEKEIESVSEITDEMGSNVAFQLYAIAVVLGSLYLIYFVAPRIGKRNIFVYVTICSIVGSLSVIGVKGLGIALKLTFAGNNQLMYASTWGFVALVAVSIMTQMNYLNMALDTFNTARVTPIYYVIFTTATIAASAILFRGWNSQDCDTLTSPDVYDGPTPPPAQGRRSNEDLRTSTSPAPTTAVVCSGGYSGAALLTCLCGFLTICSGVYLLHLSREESEKNNVPDDEVLRDAVSRRADNQVIAMSTFRRDDEDFDSDEYEMGTDDRRQLIRPV